jgi:hypothetical protein
MVLHILRNWSDIYLQFANLDRDRLSRKSDWVIIVAEKYTKVLLNNTLFNVCGEEWKIVRLVLGPR